MKRSNRRFTVQVRSLLVTESILQSSTTPQELPVLRVEDVECVGLDGAVFYTYCWPSELLSLLTNVVSMGTTYWDPELQCQCPINPKSPRGRSFPRLVGDLGPFRVTIYHDDRVSFSGSLSRLLYPNNLKLLGPEEVETALTLFAEQYGFDLRHWIPTSVEFAFQFLSTMRNAEMAEHWGPYRGHAFPVLYDSEDGRPDPEGTQYYQVMDEGGALSDLVDPLKRYSKLFQLLDVHGLELILPDGCKDLIRLERTIRFDRLAVLDADGKPSKKSKGKKGRKQMRITLGDLANPAVYETFVQRLVSTYMDIDKYGIMPKPLDRVKGDPHLNRERRPLALAALENITEAHNLSGPGANDRTFLLDLQRRHGNITDPRSYWGRTTTLLRKLTEQDTQQEWERFDRQWK